MAEIRHKMIDGKSALGSEETSRHRRLFWAREYLADEHRRRGVRWSAEENWGRAAFKFGRAAQHFQLADEERELKVRREHQLPALVKYSEALERNGELRKAEGVRDMAGQVEKRIKELELGAKMAREVGFSLGIPNGAARP
jgi:hypothetical protein